MISVTVAVVLETRGKGSYGTGETTVDKYLVNKLERSKVVRWMALCLRDTWVFLFPGHAVGCLPGVGQHLERKINFPAIYAYDPDTAHGNTEHSLSALLLSILECLRHSSSLRTI